MYSKLYLYLLPLLFFSTLSNAQVTGGSGNRTTIYFQNNTHSNVRIFSTSTLDGQYIADSSGGGINAWAYQEDVTVFSREDGTGTSSDVINTVNTAVILGTDTVVLQFRMTSDCGLFSCDTKGAFSAKGPGFNAPWYDENSLDTQTGDYPFYSDTFSSGGVKYVLKYRSYTNNTSLYYEDIYYVLHELDPYPVNESELKDSNILNVLSYNIYMLPKPPADTDQWERAGLLHKYLKGYDALLVTEAFHNSARARLKDSLKAMYPHQTNVLSKTGPIVSGFINGGALILSRWPILRTAEMIWEESSETDALADKGVVYAEINKLGKKYSLFVAHAQSDQNSADSFRANTETRKKQFRQFSHFIDTLDIPKNQAVVLAGDFNVDRIANKFGEYDSMFAILNTNEPEYIGDTFTYHGGLNKYIAFEGFSKFVEHLDYAFTLKTHRPTVTATNNTLIMRHIEEDLNFWDNTGLNGNDGMWLDISDHFAVHGRFVFPSIVAQPKSLVVCEGDSFSLTTQVDRGNPTYQWEKNGQMIVGATDSVYTAIAQLSDTGLYACVIRYSSGVMYTDTATIAVSSKPKVEINISGNQLSVVSGHLENNTYQWYNATTGMSIDGATDTSYLATQKGAYYLRITSDKNCTDTSNTKEFVPTNVIDVAQILGVSIYPNPVSETLYIRVEKKIDNKTRVLELRNLLGELILSKPIDAQMQTIDVSSLSRGIYILSIISGKDIFSIRVVLN